MASFPLAEWRLIIEAEPRSGAHNMAVDEALAEAAAREESPPTLRFYRWERPTLSLGRLQPTAHVDEEALSHAGVDLVRRATGGRAILHYEELTYAVAAPVDEPRMSGAIMDVYLRISEGLVSGLNSLGLGAINAEGSARAGRNVSPACFEIPSAYEIVIHGRKLIGSAQSRRGGHVLQHGSMPLTGSVSRIVDYLSLGQEERDALRTRLDGVSITFSQARELSRLPDDPPTFEAIAHALAMGMARRMNLSFTSGTLLPQESRRASELIRTRYAHPDWTYAR